MIDLPTGWMNAPINEIIAHDGIFCDGDWVESKDQDPEGSIRLLQLADVGDGKFLDKSSRFINEWKFDELRCTEVFTGDIMVARMPEPIGRACLVPRLTQRCITVVDVAIIRPGSDSVHPAWLMHSLNSPVVRQMMELESSGTTRRRISRRKLSAIELPIPPINEQKRIADKLDTLLSRIDTCRYRMDKVPHLLKRFREAVIAEATSGELTADWREENGISQEWTLHRIEELTTKVGSGATPKGGEAAYQNSGVPLIRSMNVVFFGFKRDGLAYLNEKQAYDLRHVEVCGNDVLLNITGASIGRACLAPVDLAGARVNQHVCIIRPVSDLLPGYLCAFLSSPDMQKVIGAENYGVTRQALTKQQILNFEVLVPTVEEQHEIVNRVDHLFAYADRLEAHYTDACARIEQLTPTLLDKAFRGELVPQDPSDEPAAVLLEHIRSSRAAEAAHPKRQKVRRITQMTRTTSDTVRELIRKLPQDSFTFDDLRKQVPIDYESLKDIVFTLLSEETPSMRQIFNPEIQAMQFVKVKL